MKSILLFTFGILWVWLYTPTYDQLYHPFWSVVALTFGAMFVMAGLIGIWRDVNKLC